MIIIMLSLATSQSFAQEDTKAKSSTQSALCTAQAETFKSVFDSLYLIDDKVDINKVYKNEITEKTAKCLAEDLILWGNSVIEDAQNGQFKRYRLSFEKPSDNKFKVPRRAKRAYRKAFKKIKRDFISSRKSKTLDEIMDDKYLKKYLTKTTKAFVRQKDRYIRKITR